MSASAASLPASSNAPTRSNHGVGLIAPADHIDLGTKSMNAGRQGLTNRAITDDEPTCARNLAERRGLPFFGDLLLGLGPQGMQDAHDLRHHILSNRHALGAAVADPNALIGSPLIHRVIKTGIERL